MGNMESFQCAVPTIYEEDVEARLSSARRQLPGIHEITDYLNCRSSALAGEKVSKKRLETAQFQFLQAHMRDRPRNTLLENRLVVDALVEQVEELIRRAKEEEELSDGGCSITSNESNHQKHGGDMLNSVEGREIGAPSEISLHHVTSIKALSVVTRASGATQPTGNKRMNKTMKQRSVKRLEKPHMIGGNKTFELQEDLRKFIKKAVISRARYDELSEEQGCSRPAFFTPCSISKQALSFNSMEMVIDDKMLVLHLKMPPLRCYSYYRMNLSRWKPHNPLSLAFENGLETTDLLPSRRRSGTKVLPDLGSLSDESSTSNSSELEFGSIPPSNPVRLLVTNAVFLDLAITGSLSLVGQKRRPSAAYVDRKLLKRPDQYIVLLNRRSGIPIAVCALKTPIKGPPVVRIFTTKQRVFGQTKAATTKQLGINWSGESLPLYPWAEFVTEGEYPERVRYSIFLTTGKYGEFEGDPSYRASHISPGSPEILVVGRTEREAYRSGCAILNICLTESGDDAFMKVSIARGIDPALLICFAAFIDEAMEMAMRKQYKSSE